MGDNVAVAISQVEDGGLLPSLQLPLAGFLSSDVPPLFPVLVEVVLDEGFDLCIGNLV